MDPALKYPDYVPALDGWRAVAIAMVLFSHVRLPGQALSRIAVYGALGVHLFFAISGFLITDRLLREEQSRGRIGLGAFYIRRVFRILPAAFVYLAVVGVLGAVRLIPMDGGQLLSSALFWRNYYVEPAAQSWYTGHFWSLAVEEHFYLLWPGLLVALGTRRARWTAPALACGFAVWRALDTLYAWVAAFHPAWKDLIGRTDYRMDGLLWGCAAAFVWNAPAARDWLANRGRATYGLIAIAAMALVLMFEPPGYVAWLAMLMPVPLILTAADQASWFGRVFEWRGMRWFGRISYSVYLWQMLFLPAYGIPVSLGVAQQFPMNIALAVGAASISYYVIERPCRSIGRTLAKGRVASRAVPAAAGTA